MPRPSQSGGNQALNNHPGGDRRRTEPYRDPHPIGGHVVMIALERARRDAQQLGEGVQLMGGHVADQMGPEPPVRRPPGRVDVEHTH